MSPKSILKYFSQLLTRTTKLFIAKLTVVYPFCSIAQTFSCFSPNSFTWAKKVINCMAKSIVNHKVGAIEHKIAKKCDWKFLHLDRRSWANMRYLVYSKTIEIELLGERLFFHGLFHNCENIVMYIRGYLKHCNFIWAKRPSQ